ncbi:hypothetical protein [Synechococcus sp. CBW1108]|uniref:hypothetical protein n=1 Tax=Synechococcus sp. CBW1108 TaxID=1353147 RepID=UPI0018CE5BD5|nr:hypothetical protein [Synechococcus sp. CBW1108]QPN69191.1 hypothetical protein H8F27_11240 [Synechococcus sp. CBW1108]
MPLSGVLLEKLPTRPKLSARAARLDDLDLAEAEGLAEAVEPCLDAVIEAH